MSLHLPKSETLLNTPSARIAFIILKIFMETALPLVYTVHLPPLHPQPFSFNTNVICSFKNWPKLSVNNNFGAGGSAFEVNIFFSFFPL